MVVTNLLTCQGVSRRRCQRRYTTGASSRQVAVEHPRTDLVPRRQDRALSRKVSPVVSLPGLTRHRVGLEPVNNSIEDFCGRGSNLTACRVIFQLRRSAINQNCRKKFMKQRVRWRIATMDGQPQSNRIYLKTGFFTDHPLLSLLGGTPIARWDANG